MKQLKNEQISNEELIQTALQLIGSNRSAQRIRGVKLIRKHRLSQLGEQLYAVFLRELKDTRTWEVKSEMLKAIGAINFTAAVDEIEKIAAQNLPQDTVTSSAACALVRIKRAHENDASWIIKLLKEGSYSVVMGAVTTLAVDKMMPREAEILEILRLTKDAHGHKDRQGLEFGLLDPRVFVAAACTNWLDGSQTQQEAVRQWLCYCKVTAVYHNKFGEERADLRLIEICDLALKGKFPKAYVGF